MTQPHPNGTDSQQQHHQYQTLLNLQDTIRNNIEKLCAKELPPCATTLLVNDRLALCKELTEARLHLETLQGCDGYCLQVVEGTEGIIKEYVYKNSVSLSEHHTTTLLKLLQWCDSKETLSQQFTTEILIELAYRINQSNAISTYNICVQLLTGTKDQNKLLHSVMDHCKAVIQILSFDKRANDIVGFKECENGDLLRDIVFGSFQKLSFHQQLSDCFMNDLLSIYNKGNVKFNHDNTSTNYHYYSPAILIANNAYFDEYFHLNSKAANDEPIDLYHLGLTDEELDSIELPLKLARISFVKKLVYLWYTGSIDLTREEALMSFRVCEFLKIEWTDPLITHCLNIVSSNISRENCLDISKQLLSVEQIQSREGLNRLKDSIITTIIMNWEHFPREELEKKLSKTIFIEIVDAMMKKN